MDDERNGDPQPPAAPMDGWSACWHPAGYARVTASHPQLGEEAHYRVDMDEHVKPLNALAREPGPLGAARRAVADVPTEVFPLRVSLGLAWEHQVAQRTAAEAPQRDQRACARAARQAHLRLVGETMRTRVERTVARNLLAKGFAGTPEELHLMVAETIVRIRA